MKKDSYHKLPVFHFAQTLEKRHQRKNLKCLLFGNFGAMNIGDEAILAGQITELKKIPNITITVVARYPNEITRLHKVRSISMYQFEKARREIKKSDFVIVGGGGLINKAERGIIGFVYQFYMLFTFFYLPRFYKKKLYILGVGIYANAHPFVTSVALPLMKNASLITVRDQHSFDYLKKNHIHATFYKDNSYLMDVLSEKEVLQAPFFEKSYHKRTKNIGLSLVKPNSSIDEKHLISEIAKFVQEAHKNTTFWFYPADSNPGYEGDTALIERVLAEVKNHTSEKIEMNIIPKIYSPELFFSSIRLMDGMIAMRLHTLIFAYRLGVPFTGISYDTKIRSFLESVGKKPLEFKKFTAAEVKNTIL